ncbi:uncharacterized protein LOC125757199 [Rhipicephalus sanguineus]|uniref:uncharacterized protein LOC125757199 n=1 Tax=Rhipicephalus sanguineus TaxID=34632 RepID=UPI0020C2F5F3|nr:uncharacterized protein LOC125757199 [Rhipicephalus sanguineus]
MLRWSLTLSVYEYKLEYRKTQDHGNADCLSRPPIPGDRPDIELPGDVLMLEAVEYPPVSAEDVASATLRDPCLSRVKKWVRAGWPEQGVPPEYAVYKHSTPHTETGRTPAELMLGRSFRSALSSMQPDVEDVWCTRQPNSTFQRGDPVYVRNFSRGPKWLAAYVLRSLGHVMYEVQTTSGAIHRRHREHVRRAWKSAPPDTADPHFQFPATPATVTRSPVREATVPADNGPTSTAPDTAQACRRSTRARRPVLRYGIDC